MSYRKKRFTKEKKWHQVGKDYEPYINVRDFPSQGRVSRVLGETTGRVHHLFSELEYYAFLAFDYNQDIIDIREQYPLHKTIETIDIAMMLGYKHPTEIGSGVPIMMTTDFLLTKRVDNQLISKARAVKTEEDLENKRTQEKLEIERHYWKRKGVEWKIITEKSFNETELSNLIKIRQTAPMPENLKIWSEEFRKEYEQSSQDLERFLYEFEKQRNLKKGSGHRIFRCLLRDHKIDVDLKQIVL